MHITLDVWGNVGEFTSLALDYDGQPGIPPGGPRVPFCVWGKADQIARLDALAD